MMKDKFYHLDIPKGWDIRPLGKLSSINTGSKNNQDQVIDGKFPFFVRSQNVVKINSYSFDGEAILIPGEGNIGEIFHYINGKFDYHQRVYKISNFVDILGKYAYYTISHFFKRETVRHSVKATVDSLRLPTFTEMLIMVPPISDQKAIIKVLETWDRSIEITKALILKKEHRCKWLTSSLLTGKKRSGEHRVNKNYHKTNIGELPTDWQLKSLDKVLTSVRKSFTPEQNEYYQEIGIRSHAKGLFYKPKITGKELGEKRVFWVEPNCFILNIVFAWEHAIAKTTEKNKGLIASHRFPMFKPKSGILDLDYLLYFFKSARGKHLLSLASPGGAGRNKTLGQAEFMKLQIPIPGINEQKYIVSVLNSAYTELDLLRQSLVQLQNQKKGLMQQLLTGKIRVGV